MVAWGNAYQSDAVQACAATQSAIVYGIQDVTLTPSAEGVTLMYAGFVGFQWWVLVPSGQPSAVAANVTACLSAGGLIDVVVSAVGQAAVRPRVAQPCGVYSEANVAGTACTCVAGYAAALSSQGLGICAPCMNGTARARYAEGGCAACPAHSVAESMAMTGCVCLPGFSMAADGVSCVPAPSPWAIMGLLTTPATAVGLAAAVVATLLLVTGALCTVLL